MFRRLDYSNRPCAETRLSIAAKTAFDWCKRLLVIGAMSTAIACTCQQELEQKPSWSEPYYGQVAQDDIGNFYMAERFIVRFKEPMSDRAVERMIRNFDGRVTGFIQSMNAYEIEAGNIDSAIAAMQGQSKVEFAGRNYYFKATAEWDNKTYSNDLFSGFVSDYLWWLFVEEYVLKQSRSK
jgi:hypothetical protein